MCGGVPEQPQSGLPSCGHFVLIDAPSRPPGEDISECICGKCQTVLHHRNGYVWAVFPGCSFDVLNVIFNHIIQDQYSAIRMGSKGASILMWVSASDEHVYLG